MVLQCWEVLMMLFHPILGPCVRKAVPGFRSEYVVAVADLNISSHLCPNQRVPDFVGRVKAVVGRIEVRFCDGPPSISHLQVGAYERLPWL